MEWIRSPAGIEVFSPLLLSRHLVMTATEQIFPLPHSDSVEPEYTDAAKKAKITGTCLVSLVIDANGMPQDVRVIKSLLPSLDERAVEAI